MDKIWIKNYPPGVPEEISIGHLESLVTVFEEACRKFADKTAYISMDKEMTYRELDSLSRDFA
ncbi:MAG: long-chain-fatty-acid--CoA ligase, partial [Betaproteobacteria bacterium]